MQCSDVCIECHQGNIMTYKNGSPKSLKSHEKADYVLNEQSGSP